MFFGGRGVLFQSNTVAAKIRSCVKISVKVQNRAIALHLLIDTDGQCANNAPTTFRRLERMLRLVRERHCAQTEDTSN